MPTEKPKTQKEMLEQLWIYWIGTNGEGAGAKIDRLCRNAMTKDDCRDIRAAQTGGVSRKTITFRRILEVAVVAIVMGSVGAGVLLLLIGKLTPEDIVNILEAWKGGGT